MAKQHSGVLEFAAIDFRDDTEIVTEAVRLDGRQLRFASSNLRANRIVVLEAVKQHGLSLKYASDEIKEKDREVVTEAVMQDGFALMYACHVFQSDRCVVMAAVQQAGCAIQYASFDLKKDYEVLMTAVKSQGEAIAHSNFCEPDFRCNLSLAAVQQNGEALEYLAQYEKNNKQIVLEAVKQSGLALRFAGYECRKDYTIVLAAVQKNPRALHVADIDLQSDAFMIKFSKTSSSKRLLFRFGVCFSVVLFVQRLRRMRNRQDNNEPLVCTESFDGEKTLKKRRFDAEAREAEARAQMAEEELASKKRRLEADEIAHKIHLFRQMGDDDAVKRLKSQLLGEFQGEFQFTLA
jgi:hypothetical protein